jgi:hypothetical protein
MLADRVDQLWYGHYGDGSVYPEAAHRSRDRAGIMNV